METDGPVIKLTPHYFSSHNEYHSWHWFTCGILLCARDYAPFPTKWNKLSHTVSLYWMPLKYDWLRCIAANVNSTVANVNRLLFEIDFVGLSCLIAQLFKCEVPPLETRQLLHWQSQYACLSYSRSASAESQGSSSDTEWVSCKCTCMKNSRAKWQALVCRCWQRKEGRKNMTLHGELWKHILRLPPQVSGDIVCINVA